MEKDKILPEEKRGNKEIPFVPNFFLGKKESFFCWKNTGKSLDVSRRFSPGKIQSFPLRKYKGDILDFALFFLQVKEILFLLEKQWKKSRCFQEIFQRKDPIFFFEKEQRKYVRFYFGFSQGKSWPRKLNIIVLGHFSVGNFWQSLQ